MAKILFSIILFQVKRMGLSKPKKSLRRINRRENFATRPLRQARWARTKDFGEAGPGHDIPPPRKLSIILDWRLPFCALAYILAA